MTLDISRGGVIAVDTAVLRDVAERIDAMHARLGHALQALDRAHAACAAQPQVMQFRGFLFAARARAEEQAAALRADADSVRCMADAYEIVDLRARADLVERSDPRAVADLRARLAAMSARNPDAAELANLLSLDLELRNLGIRADSNDPWTVVETALSPIAMRGARWLLDLGMVRAGARLWGWTDPIDVRQQVGPSAGPPTTTADLLRRIDAGDTPDDTRVRIERYEFEDGHAEFVAYIEGTQLNPFEAWDWFSNFDLYVMQRMSESYAATQQMLTAAGVRPGDVLHIAGHSQGAMIGAYVAVSGEYEVQTFVSVGNPVTVELSDTVDSVDFRHTNDPVAGLAAGRTPAGVGSDESVVVTREIAQEGLDPFYPHGLDRYVQTAELLDESDDPRADVLAPLFAHLGTATAVTTTVYSARRAMPWRPGSSKDVD